MKDGFVEFELHRSPCQATVPEISLSQNRCSRFFLAESCQDFSAIQVRTLRLSTDRFVNLDARAKLELTFFNFWLFSLQPKRRASVWTHERQPLVSAARTVVLCTSPLRSRRFQRRSRLSPALPFRYDSRDEPSRGAPARRPSQQSQS